jgi:ectoine hydroxylase-related dioxygenase (phytanoyl-CoA dioxygenase family)
MSISHERGKQAERYVAKAVGGKRVIEKGVNNPDVRTSLADYEVKKRDKLPVLLTNAMAQAIRNADNNKMPVVVLLENGHPRDAIVCIRLQDWIEHFGG